MLQDSILRGKLYFNHCEVLSVSYDSGLFKVWSVWSTAEVLHALNKLMLKDWYLHVGLFCFSMCMGWMESFWAQMSFCCSEKCSSANMLSLFTVKGSPNLNLQKQMRLPNTRPKEYKWLVGQDRLSLINTLPQRGLGRTGGCHQPRKPFSRKI